MLRMISKTVIEEFIGNKDLGKMILNNPDVPNSTIVLEKSSLSGKIMMSNRYVFSQHHDDRLSLGQYNNPEQIIHVAHMMGCTHYDPEVLEDEIEKAKYNRQMIDAVLRNSRSTS